MKYDKLNRYILIGYALTGSVHILLNKYENVHHLTKPLLMPLLLLYAVMALRASGATPPLALLVALLASFLGDSFLMYETLHPAYFMAGLGSFLLAHLAYIFLFMKTSEPVPLGMRIKKQLTVLGGLLVYAVGLLFVLLPKVGALKLPLIVYAAVLSVMSMTAFLRVGGRFTAHGFLVALGSLLFVISDSLLAVNKFLTPLPYAHVWIMGTYLTAQYWIVRGVVLYEQEKSMLKNAK